MSMGTDPVPSPAQISSSVPEKQMVIAAPLFPARAKVYCTPHHLPHHPSAAPLQHREQEDVRRCLLCDQLRL